MNTLRAYLAMMLVAAFTLVSFLAALNGYRSSLEQAQLLMDSQLKSTSSLLMANYIPDLAEQDLVLAANKQFAFQIWQDDKLIQRSKLAPKKAIIQQTRGFGYANFAGYRWRTLAKTNQEQRRVIVAEREDLRYKLAENIALKSIMPLLLWLPLSALMVWLLVGLGLRPLRQLSRQINTKRSDDLNPIDYENPPGELVQLIDSTNALLSRLNASFEREKHFASHAAHELRTPISVLKVHLHNLSAETNSESLSHLKAGIDRMQHLVEQILDLNRSNPDIIKAQFKTLDLHQLVQRVSATLWPAFADKQQNLSLSGEPVLLNGDEGLLETLVQNLLDNASKYSPTGGEINIYTGTLNGMARLQVSDTGPGIPEEQQQKVFERFYRVNDNKLSSSSGLGLAIVQHITQLHKAAIELTNKPEGGLTVTIDFPFNEGVQ